LNPGECFLKPAGKAATKFMGNSGESGWHWGREILAPRKSGFQNRKLFPTSLIDLSLTTLGDNSKMATRIDLQILVITNHLLTS
jgi:hypothetical protein